MTKSDLAACQQSLECHKWHYRYFTAAGSPTASAVYARAITRLEHFMLTPHKPKYQPKQVYQPTKRGHYAPRQD